MAVAIRLKRTGRRNRACFRICVMDNRTRRDGRPIEELGFYDPVQPEGTESNFSLNEERAAYWLSVGAQPSETVRTLLRRQGVEIPSKKKTSTQ
ncbi:MAG: 30S ribosomal protein S16 [Planctomycetota bacterium]|nr:30S ribosomal protein S16 [Planctomycetota bacterium]MDP6940580.1 30S ribosomal protein S16 [Planctomycetota bacterium]